MTSTWCLGEQKEKPKVYPTFEKDGTDNKKITTEALEVTKEAIYLHKNDSYKL